MTLKPNPAEVSIVDLPSNIALDAEYRWGLVYHCNSTVKVLADSAYGECRSCHRHVPMQRPSYICGHQDFDGTKCGATSPSRAAMEYHVVEVHTEHCPVCRGLIGSGAGGKGCQCPR